MEPLVLLSVLPSVAMMFLNGWTDAPVSVASAVNSGAVTLKRAALIAAICNFCGAAFASLLGNTVAVSVIEITGVADMGGKVKQFMLISAMLSVAAWSLITLYFGIPTSESHALMASLTGGAAAISGTVNISGWGQVIFGLIVSTVPVIFISKYVAGCFEMLQKRVNFKSKTLKKAQIFGAAASSFAHGAQDGQKFAALLAVQVAVTVGANTERVFIPLFLGCICAVVISLGMLLGGKRIINAISKMSVPEPVYGVAADFTSAFVLMLLSVFGIPVSTTAAKTTAVMGAGGRVKNAVKNAVPMLFAWFLTFPACGVLAFLLTKILLAVA